MNLFESQYNEATALLCRVESGRLDPTSAIRQCYARAQTFHGAISEMWKDIADALVGEWAAEHSEVL